MYSAVAPANADVQLRGAFSRPGRLRAHWANGCAVARQYSSAVSRPTQSPNDVTQLNTSLTAIMFTFEAAGILSVEGL